MINSIKRRSFLKKLVAIPVLASPAFLLNARSPGSPVPVNPGAGSRLKISLNAFSFNEPLRSGSMTLEDVLEFCAAKGFDAVDLTGYYFPGYPNTPPDEYVYKLKRKAFLLGLDISGTGVRNDFTDPDETKRKADIILVKNWIESAAKLGAPVIRIFAGNISSKDYSWEQVAKWMVDDVRVCVEHGKKHGVIVAIQNHNDFIKTAEQAQTIIKMINSEWSGLILDIGSYRIGDPYQQIAQTAPHAVNWQIKENMFVNGIEVKTDLDKVIGIIKSSGYRGYLPIETLGSGDPKLKVPVFLEQVRKALGNV